MYATCLFCHEDLGHNEILEVFPIGRRLAFDASKGRLWVVCRKCERWNLTPLEERWEAIEECERLFTSTRLRVSTDNIGLARLSEGLELVRIGNALRPEIAAWRYGDQFGRRRRKYMLVTGAAVAAVGGIIILGPATGIVAGGGWGTWQIATNLYNAYQNRRVRARLRAPGSDAIIPVRKKQLSWVSVVRADDGWGLRVPVPRSWAEDHALTGVSRQDDDSIRRQRRNRHFAPRASVLYTGKEALQAASKLMPAINEKGARSQEVQSAVKLVADAADPMRLFERYAGRSAAFSDDSGHVIHNLPQEVRIALEMASHEEQERRALEGELAILEAAWRDAEEIAKIADDMFVPDSATQRLEELKRNA
jgi:hypothetical protein